MHSQGVRIIRLVVPFHYNSECFVACDSIIATKRRKSYITGHLYCKSFENNDFFIQRFLLFFICSFISIKGKLSISHLHLQRLENGFNRNCFVSMNFLKEETMLIHVEPV